MSPWPSIAALMQKHGVNGKELAQIAGASPSAVVKWKRGSTIGVEYLNRIAMHFGQSLDALLGAASQANASEASHPPKPDSSNISGPAMVRESPPPYGSDLSQVHAITAHLAKSCTELSTRMSNVEQLLLALLAEQRRINTPPPAPQPQPQHKEPHQP